MRILIVGLAFALWLLLSAWSQTGHGAAPMLPATVSPEPVCTPPSCPAWGRLVCGEDDGCPGGCGTVCRQPIFLPLVGR